MDKEKNTTLCVGCETTLSDERIHLGFTDCVECSKVDKYSSHTIYPHKTGGFIQPVSAEQADNMKRLDRRSVGGERRAKGIVADNSWDRWLKDYLSKKDSPPSEPKSNPLPTPLPIFIPYQKAINEALAKFEDRGYEAAAELTQSMYTSDKISLAHKAKIMNELSSLALLTTKQRRWMKKL
jgi:hypothetical protein|tara:strand:+ start:351 stop:893 length:543 start_codon:yes stop_codon:yes gene_type:complete